MIQRLALAVAGMTGSSALALDEVLTGIDPLVANRLRGRIADLAGAGRVVLIASRELATLERLATRVLVLWEGRLYADVDVARLVTERMAELSLSGSALARTEYLFQRFPESIRTGEGIAIPLTNGLTMEKVLATCRAARVAVAASRVRYRALEDILHVAAARQNGDPRYRASVQS
jgi:ABC-type multidrug transport system ATPase subunit